MFGFRKRAYFCLIHSFIQQGPGKLIKSAGRDIHNITKDFSLLINAKRTTTIFNIDNVS